MRDPHVGYVSIKVSAVAPQLNHWAFDDSLAPVTVRLRDLFRAARDASPTVFVNLDIEEYHDLELTIAAFTSVLDKPEFHELRAGVVLQAYLPDAFGALQGLIDWAGRRSQAGGADIKIRLVKGANLVMERVDAVMHGWQQAPYPTKLETDANDKRCLDWALQPERLVGVRIGVASHNLFDVAWAWLTAQARGVTDRVDFEMLQGMAPAQSRAVRMPPTTLSSTPPSSGPTTSTWRSATCSGDSRRTVPRATSCAPCSRSRWARPRSTPRPNDSGPRSCDATTSRPSPDGNPIRRSRASPARPTPSTSETKHSSTRRYPPTATSPSPPLGRSPHRRRRRS